MSTLALAVRPGAARTRRASARLLGVLTILALIALLGASKPSTAAAAPAAGTFGINPGDLFKLAESKWDAHLSAMQADGIETVRMGAWWSDLEPGPPVNGVHTYSWSELDPKVAALARHGLRWEPLICFSATWDSKIDGDYTGAPKSPDNLAAFAGALATRYGPGGEFWQAHPDLPQLPVEAYELWNEQNASVYWRPAADGPEDYADLYAAVHASVHAAQPDARVVVGGLAATVDGVLPADDFVARMLAHRPGLKGRIDAVGYHPYAHDPEAVLGNLAKFRRRLDALAGAGVPIEVTEIGWTTVDVSESRRAGYLAEVTRKIALSDCGVERVSAYAWVGPEISAGDREQWFGIAREDASRKESARAYADAIRTARSSNETIAVCGGGAPQDAAPATRESGADATGSQALRVRVKQSRRRGRLILKASCASECRLRVDLRRARTARASRRIAKASRGASRRHSLRLKLARRYRRPGTRLRVTVTAVDATGTRIIRAMRVRGR